MKHIPILLTLLVFSFQNYSQDYISYFNLCNQADKYIYQEQYDSAMISFDKAFQLVDYIHIDYLIKASNCAAKQNDIKATNDFVVRAINHGAHIDFVNTKDFKKYRKTELYNELMDSLICFKYRQIVSLNSVYISHIDSLYYIDQNIIRGANYVKGNYDLSSIELPENRYQLDSSNLKLLIELINKFGFPSEKLVGKECSSKANIILHHNLRLPQYNETLIEFKRYVYSGEYLPSDYAWTYDQSLVIAKQKPVYYFWVGNFNELTNSELVGIDSLRYELGIKPTEATRIKINKKSIQYFPVW